MKDPAHPIWFILRFVCLLVFLVVFSWLNATKFDETEAKMIAGVGIRFRSSGWLGSPAATALIRSAISDISPPMTS